MSRDKKFTTFLLILKDFIIIRDILSSWFSEGLSQTRRKLEPEKGGGIEMTLEWDILIFLKAQRYRRFKRFKRPVTKDLRQFSSDISF